MLSFSWTKATEFGLLVIVILGLEVLTVKKQRVYLEIDL